MELLGFGTTTVIAALCCGVVREKEKLTALCSLPALASASTVSTKFRNSL
jgi:hypothetical protein